MRKLVLVLFGLVLSLHLLAQSLPTVKPSPDIASSLISTLARQSGWSTSPMDVVATGVIRGGEDAVDAGSPYKVLLRGSNQIRYEVILEGITAITIVNSLRAARIVDNKPIEMPVYVALSGRVPIAPFMTALQSVGTDKDAVYVGSEQLGNELTEVVDIIPRVDGDRSSSFGARNFDRNRLWISRKTGLLLQMSYVRLGTSNPHSATTYIRRYSDYRNVKGRLFAFHQEQAIQGGETELILDFSEVQVDSGLDESRFSIPATKEAN